MNERDEICKILIRKTEVKRLFGRSRRIWEDNIKMGRRKIGWESVDSFQLVVFRDQWRAVVNTVYEPSGSIRNGEFLEYLSDC